MPRKRLTQLFPALIPLRQAQRRLFCLVGMRLDRRRYAGTQWGAVLPQRVFADSSPLLNPDTGFDLRYQWNKVHNIQLAVDKLDRLLIRPGETFSFCWAVRDADKVTPYKDGLIVVDGKLTTAPGGGLCHLTNLLFWLFLHSPLAIVERSGHREKDFPDPGDQPAGTDATFAAGWLDLKVRNDTGRTYQLLLEVANGTLSGSLQADRREAVEYQVRNRDLRYYRQGEAVYQEVDVLQQRLSRLTGELLGETTLYHNRCRIGYPLPAGVTLQEKG